MKPNAKTFAILTTVLLLTMALVSTNLACGTQPAPTPTSPPSQPSVPSPPPAPALSPQPPPTPPTPAALTKVQFLGQACFLITSSSGLRIFTDPYTSGSSMSYSPIDEAAEIVTVSHEHSDHNNVSAVKGQPEVLRGVGVKNVKGIEFRGIASYHDDSSGKQRGANTIFCFSVDGIKFCHLGDLGHQLGADQIAEIGQVDVLFVPVGGLFTIDARIATVVASDLKPKITIPMHYKTPKVTFALSGVDEFIKEKTNVKRLSTSTLELKLGSLPATQEITVLETAK